MRFPNQIGPQALDVSQELPLLLPRERLEVAVDEQAVPEFSGMKLERQRDEISESDRAPGARRQPRTATAAPTGTPRSGCRRTGCARVFWDETGTATR